MTSRYHGSKNSGSEQPYLIETAFALKKNGSKITGYRFGPECSLAVESLTCQFFFLPYLQDHSLSRSRNFATIAT